MTRLTAVLIALSLASCGVPRDPEATLERVRGGEMRVGVTSSDPWATWPGDEPSGVEVAVATFISLSIDSDGFKNLKRAVSDLMDGRPAVVDGSAIDPIVARVDSELDKRSWVKEASVRLRESGHVFFGEALIVPRSQDDLADKIQRTRAGLLELDWRLYDIAISPVESMEPPEEEQSREMRLGQPLRTTTPPVG